MTYQDDLFREEQIDIKEILFKAWRHWKIFLGSLIITLGIAFFYTKQQQPKYECYSTVLINSNRPDVDPESIFGFDIFQNKDKIYNDIEILKSSTLFKEAIDKLHLGVSYFEEGHFYNSEIYKVSPFKVVFDSNAYQPLNFKIKVRFINADSIEVEIPSGEAPLYNFAKNEAKSTDPVLLAEETKYVKPGEFLTSGNYSFAIILTEFYQPDVTNQNNYFFKFSNFKTNVDEFSNLKFEIIDKSSVIKVSLVHHNLLKAVDFLNTLTSAFLDKELNRKNIVADKALKFIDSHLSEINDSLYKSEKNLQNYQASKSALNMDFQTEKMFELLEDLQNQKADVLIKKKYYDYLAQTLEKKTDLNEVVAPSVMNINNPILTAQITNLIDIQSELNNLKLSSDVENPYFKVLSSRIENSKNVLLETLTTENKSTDIALSDINTRLDKTMEKINVLPKTQRELFNYERSFKVFDNIYTFLLQKRSETLLAKASNIPLNEIIDQAKLSNYKLASSNSKLNYLIALVLGMLIPAIFVYVKYYFNSKILEDTDIEKEIDLPILGHIIRNKESDPKSVFTDPKSIISESFRTLRTNLDFARKHDGSQVILISSSIQGEGKSFISDNLAYSLALNNKKTILLVFDLRKPQIYLEESENNIGLTNFLIGKCDANEIIEKTHNEYLDLIPSGILPPNPSELISSERTASLFKKLRERYDYVIIDTPPIGIISDGLVLTKYSDINIFVFRYNLTPLKLFIKLMENVKSKSIGNINLLGNSLETNKKGYGYHYGSYGNYHY